MGYQRDRKQKVDLVLKALVEGEGPAEGPVPLTLVNKCVYEVFPVCENGIPTLLTQVLEHNRVLCVRGKLTNANLVIVIQQGEETPVNTTVTDENFKVYLKLKKNDKFSFELQAGDNFVVQFKAVLKKRKRKPKRKPKRGCGCDSY